MANEEQTMVERILEARGHKYGPFIGHATLSQGMKYVCHSHPRWGSLAADKKEAIEMILHKIGRIVNGDPDYKDSWDDIAGYAQLIARGLFKG